MYDSGVRRLNKYTHVGTDYSITEYPNLVIEHRLRRYQANVGTTRLVKISKIFDIDPAKLVVYAALLSRFETQSVR